MKVLKLNEASSSEILDAEDSFRHANNVKEKLNILRNFLGDDVYSSLNQISDPVKLKWVDAMKWGELGRSDNEFINLLKNFKGSIPFINDENFVKIYNAYSDGTIPKDANDNGNIVGDVITDPNLYIQSDDGVRYIFKVIDRLKSRGDRDEDIRSKIYNGTQLKSAEEIRSDLNDTSKISDKIKSDLEDLSEDDALSVLKTLLNRKDLGETPIAILNKLGLIR